MRQKGLKISLPVIWRSSGLNDSLDRIMPVSHMLVHEKHVKKDHKKRKKSLTGKR